MNSEERVAVSHVAPMNPPCGKLPGWYCPDCRHPSGWLGRMFCGVLYPHIGVVNFAPGCPPGWVGAAIALYDQAALDEAVRLALGAQAPELKECKNGN